jgi:beta-galactosidase
MNSQQFSALFPLGSHLCREPMPPITELKRDMETLRRHGFNLVKLQEHWMIDEPAEGQYDFSRYEELIAHAAGLDMGVYLGLTCEQAPGWLYRKHPGCRMVGRDGRVLPYQAPTTLPADGKPGPCYDHPGALADMTRFITKLVETLGRFENVAVWNTWQEIGYWPLGLVGTGVCFCDCTLAKYRGWLQGRYGDLDALNRAWNTRYAAWEDILPTHADQRVQPQAVDITWQYFMNHIQISDVLTARAAAIKAADPLHRPVFAHKGGVEIGSAMDWTYARTQDFLGSSCYPAWYPVQGWDDAGQRPLDRHLALLAEMWDGVALKYDYLRSANRPGAPVWAAEFQGGPVSTSMHKGRVPSAEDMRRWMLTAVGSGITALSFWVTRAEIMAAEQNGFSLLDSEGDTTPRFAEAARIGAALNRYPALFGAATTPRADVAILVDEDNYNLCTTMGQGSEHLPYSVRGWHRLCWDQGIPADFVAAAFLNEADAQSYAALVLPFPLALSETTAARLIDYVQRGGTLICEAAPGRITEYGVCNRGEMSPLLRDFFGVRQTSFTMVREPEGGKRWSPPERTWGEYVESSLLIGDGPLVNQVLRANVYVQTFEPGDATPCLWHGERVAGVMRQAGAGRAWLLGTYLGHSGTAYRDRDSRAGMRRLFDACGIHPAHDGLLLKRTRALPEMEAWLFTNPTTQSVTETVALGPWTSAETLFGDPLPIEDGRLTLTVPSLDVAGVIVR